jgi:hypothetical protein
VPIPDPRNFKLHGAALYFCNRSPSAMAMSAIGFLLALLQVGLPLVVAAPLATDSVTVEGHDHSAVFGQHTGYRTVTVVLCILYAFLLALAHGMSSSKDAVLLRTWLTITRLSSWANGGSQVDKQNHRFVSHCARDHLYGLCVLRRDQHSWSWSLDRWSVLCCNSGVHCLVHAS